MFNKKEKEGEVSMLGAEFSPADVRDYRIEVEKNEEFPLEFELKMVRVKNQGAISSCVAHAISEVVEYHNNVQNNDTTEMSTGWIYGNRRDQILNMGKGMITRCSLESVRKYGDLPSSLFPYKFEVPKAIEKFEEQYDTLADKAAYSRFTAYYRVKTIDEIKKALMTDGPVVFAIKWFKDITVENGVIKSSCKGEITGGHCMVIYGWDERGWKILNSWGRYWGTNGTAILPYDFPIKEAYGVTDDILDKREDIVKPYDSKFKKILAKIINFLLNFGDYIKKLFTKNNK